MDRLNKILKYLWLINGFVFLIWASLYIIPQLQRMFKSRPDPKRSGIIVGEKLEEAKKENLKLHAVKLERPINIDRNDYLIIPVSQKLYPDPIKLSYSRIERPEWDPMYWQIRGLYNNLLFFNEKSLEKHLLFDKKVLIMSVSIPRKDVGDLIYYEVVVEDTNNDGMLFYKDKKYLYISDLEGKNLERFAYRIAT